MSLLEERVEKYIELQEGLTYAEEKASEYRSIQDDYGRCGYNDEDARYHSYGMSALSYENEMNEIENELDKISASHEMLTHIFIEELKQLKFTRKLFDDIQHFVNVYTDDYEIYMLSDFNTEKELIQEGLEYCETLTSNFTDYDFNKQFENSIAVLKLDAEDNSIVQENTIATYYLSDFFFILKQIINRSVPELEIYDGETSEELHMLIEILNKNE